MKHEAVEDIRQIAANWIISIDQANSDSQKQIIRNCEEWQSLHPDNRKVYQQMTKMWNAVTPHKTVDKKKYAPVGLLVIFITIGLFLKFPWQYLIADYKTIAGEIQTIQLPDGSTATLNTNSAINVDYSNKQRLIHLVRGEVLVDVSRDSAARKFIVHSKYLSAEALGTRYTVRHNKYESTLEVIESRVTVNSNHSNSQSLTLKPGQKVIANQDGLGEVIAIRSANPDWSSKQIVFNDAELRLVAERLSEYRVGMIILDDQLHNSDLRFTGVLPAHDSDAAIHLVAKSLNLQTKSWTPYLVKFESR